MIRRLATGLLLAVALAGSAAVPASARNAKVSADPQLRGTADGLILDACCCPEGYPLYSRMGYRKVRNAWRIDALKVWDVIDQ